MLPRPILDIEGKKIGPGYPTYFIADIAANHDGDLKRAIDLIFLAAESGADAAKFQHFNAQTIVSDYGFRNLVTNDSHQAKWKKSVFEIYKDASVSLDWTPFLVDACKSAGITFFTSPYAIDIVDKIDPYIPAYKVGSGDITWLELIAYIAAKQKPYMIATGASTMNDVQRAVSSALKINPQMCLMQCNTNYTASLENFKYIHLNVLNTYREIYPDLVLGLSDHTPGHSSVLGAITLGAKVVEKHFTDCCNREGPDHAFSMNPKTWREMIDRARELENALGFGIKMVEKNELETVVLQRRAICLLDDIAKGTILRREHLTMLRPCPDDAIPPYDIEKCIGRKVKNAINSGGYLKWSDLE